MLYILLPTAIVATIFLLALICGHYEDQSFKNKWPPMTDDEFVARCAPGTNRERALKVRKIISEQLGIPYEHIHPEQDFIKDLNC